MSSTVECSNSAVSFGPPKDPGCAWIVPRDGALFIQSGNSRFEPGWVHELFQVVSPSCQGPPPPLFSEKVTVEVSVPSRSLWKRTGNPGRDQRGHVTPPVNRHIPEAGRL